MAPKQQIPPVTQGPMHAVPCPHCGAPNDFRELESHKAEPGDTAACDACDGVMQITAMQPVTIVRVRKIERKMARQRVGQATTIGQGQVRKLLR